MVDKESSINDNTYQMALECISSIFNDRLLVLYIIKPSGNSTT